MRTEEKTTHKYNCNGYQKSHHGVSILGEKVFDCFVGLEEEGGRRLELVLELVFLVISMAYICLSVCLQLEIL